MLRLLKQRERCKATECVATVSFSARNSRKPSLISLTTLHPLNSVGDEIRTEDVGENGSNNGTVGPSVSVWRGMKVQENEIDNKEEGREKGEREKQQTERQRKGRGREREREKRGAGKGINNDSPNINLAIFMHDKASILLVQAQ